MMDQQNKTALFIIWTLGISYLLAGIYSLAGGEFSGVDGLIIGMIYLFIPATVTIIITKLFYKEEIKNSLQLSFRLNTWFIIAWIIAPILSFLTFGISLLVADVGFSPGLEVIFKQFDGILTQPEFEDLRASMDTLAMNPVWFTLIKGMLAGLSINAIAGFGEELGWRGFLVSQFRELHFMKASLIIGFIWGIWLAPLVILGHNYPQHPIAGVLIMTIWCILLSPLFLYITIKSKSVISASILHGTLNGTVGLSVNMVEGGNDLITGISGIPGFIALIVILGGLFIYDKYISKEKIMSNMILVNSGSDQNAVSIAGAASV